MKQIYYNKEQQKIPIKSWVTDIESGALDQAKNLSKIPFAFKHIALMPDAHQGFGMPIGGVMATKNVVIPNAVGVDIGCGMCSVKTSIKVEDFDIDTLKKIMGEIRKTIPVGFSHRQTSCEDKEMPLGAKPIYMKIVSEEWASASNQLGTLGGGNHFIEMQKGDDGFIWIMIHSGSRNLGHKVASHYNNIAKELNKKWASSIPPSYDLAFLPLDSNEGKAYLEEMDYCVEFALANRQKMMDDIQNIIYSIMFDDKKIDVEYQPMINIAHNYAVMENHFGENVMVHRKGATKATKGLKGIIPGSQGTCSYIVEGLGNKESFQSCSHGAGRKMGRKDAQRRLNLEEEKTKLEEKGIIHSIRNVKDLDEASGAYKDIDQVMVNQNDLVKILVKLEPLGVIKG
ncbi:RtcB family protein [Candidatus Pacearchaeota archaeon]|nr:RtcB family protein [Candidatus Pacearchaeota archaeon]